MDEAIRIFPDPEGTLPGMFGLLYKPVPAAFAEKEGELLVNILFQFLWIRMLDLVKDASQLAINPLFRFREDAIESSKDLDLYHIG
jgi:hypothetical protein